MTRKLRSITNKLSAAILLCLLLILWQAVSDLGLVPKFMFPSPVDVGAAFVEDFPILMANSGTTLAEGFLGLGLGIALAFVTAVLMDRYRFLYKSLYPILVITQTIPTVAIAPLLVLWMGYDMAPKIALVVIVCFFPMAVGLLDGFRSADQDTVNLLALDMKTGEIVASLPVLDDLPEGYQVAVENSAIVYDDSEGTVSTIVCNWFGAGSAGLADPDSDSSIQSYANIYDMNWLTKGNCMIAPGVERVDTVKTDSGYEMKSVWCRNDLSDTSIMKLSTATGYIYGYVQDLESGMWQYIILDFATGETVFTMDVSNKYGYNNMAIGMYAGNSGNALYCPTGYLELLCLQDRFVYLPEMPYRKVDLDKAARNVLTQEQFEQDGGDGTVASWRNTVTVENVHPNTTVSFRMNNLSGSAAELKLYAYGADGKLAEVGKELWSITDETGAAVDTLSDGTLYELRVSVADGSAFDLSEAEREIKISVVLAK